MSTVKKQKKEQNELDLEQKIEVIQKILNKSINKTSYSKLAAEYDVSKSTWEYYLSEKDTSIMKEFKAFKAAFIENSNKEIVQTTLFKYFTK